MIIKTTLLALLLLVGKAEVFAQDKGLQPGFNPNEYAELLRVTTRQRGPISDTLYPEPLKYDLVYNSPSMGMDNGWQLWVSKPNAEFPSAVISLRATTSASSSWVENLYSSMVKAKGLITLEPGFTFDYVLAEHPDATIHVGWLIGTAYLQRDIKPKLDSLYKAGVKDFFIFGHSQGGALSYFITAWIHYQQKAGKIPSDIRVKTYGSAAPKPGNLFFAYDYESYTQQGWAYNVVNTEDWVPECPLSIQSHHDFSTSNPLKYFHEGTKSLPLLAKWIIRAKFNRITNTIKRSNKKYNRIMGDQVQKYLVTQYLEDFEEELNFENLDYQRCGNQITLLPTVYYYENFLHDNPNVFRNHYMDAYQILLETYYSDQMDPEYILYTNKSFPFYRNPTILKLHEDK